MPRNLKITLGILSVAVLIGLISLRGLHQRIEHLSQEQGSEEQQRRELLRPAIASRPRICSCRFRRILRNAGGRCWMH